MTRIANQKRATSSNATELVLELLFTNKTIIATKGKNAAPYAISVGNLEFNDKPRPSYMANITQMIPILTYSLVTSRNFSTFKLR